MRVPTDKEIEEAKEYLRQRLDAELSMRTNLQIVMIEAAKQIIDIMPVVTDVEKVDDFDESFRKLGYECMGEFGIPGRRYYRKGGDDRTHQIHIFGMTDKENIERHIAVRDYLRKHTEVAERYGTLKKHLAQKFPLDIEGYCEGKDAFVKAMEVDALRWKVLISDSQK